MLDQKKGLKQLPGLCVYDGIVIIQIIDKLLRLGGVTGKEIGHVSALRGKVHTGIEAASGLKVDAPSTSEDADVDA